MRLTPADRMDGRKFHSTRKLLLGRTEQLAAAESIQASEENPLGRSLSHAGTLTAARTAGTRRLKFTHLCWQRMNE